MQFGFMTEPQVGGTYEELLALARWAEGAGFDCFARSDHYLDMEKSAPATDALATLAGLARETETIRLATLVSPITFHHPAVLAKTAATIDEMSGGRLELGIGTGWMETEHAQFGLELPDMRERFSRLFETLAYLEAAFGKKTGGFSGRHYHLDDIDVLPKPVGALPVIIGGSGMKRTPALAGQFADEYNIASSDADTVRARLAVMRDAARDAKRDPDAILISLVGLPLVGDDRADYQERLGQRAAARDMEPAEYEALLASRNIAHGTSDEVQATFAEYERLGVGRYYIQAYAALSSIDTADMARILKSARG